MWTLNTILGDFYGHIRVPNTLKLLHTQFQGTGTSLYLFRKIDVWTLKSTSYEFFIAIFVFPMSKNPIKPNFKVLGQICIFSKNRRVDPQEYIIRFFIAIFVFPCLKTPLNSISKSKVKFEKFTKIDV